MKYLFLILSLLNISLAIGGDLYYLKSDSVDLSLVPFPPIENSVEDHLDLQKVREFQIERTVADCAQASFESEGFATSFFAGEAGPLTEAEARNLVDFQEKLFNEVNFYSRILKVNFARLRPFDRDAEIIPCIPRQKSNSYPSGHAAVSIVAARSFSIIYPQHAKRFLQRAEKIATGRVLGGVHHPTDILAGRILGEEIFKALIKEPKFLSQLKELVP